MKCPKCGAQVKPGSLYCGECLQEIHWVPEYNTVETLLNKEKKAKMQMLKKQAKHLEELGRKTMPSLKKRVLACLAVLAAVCVGTAVYFYRENSYSAQYSMARGFYAREQYDKALEYADKAMSINPKKDGAPILLAQILKEQGDLEGAVKILEGNLRDHTSSQKYYMNLIMMYEETRKPDKIKNLIVQADSELIHKNFAYYLCPDPKITPETGTYDEELTVEVQEEDGVKYYYTLDGSTPTSKSPRYQQPIFIGKGVTELQVVGENVFGITSDVLYRKYTVLVEAPGPPEIKPESGNYDTDTEITVKIPDGFRAYYAFDEYPTADSTEYKAPVKMPPGGHTFYAVLIGGNDIESDVASQYYYVGN